MKVLGITCGRKLSNTEILVKEALMAAQEAGAEVELVRLHDLELKPCTGCNACVIDLMEKGGSGDCVIKDDLALIDDKIMDADALVVGSPIYEKSPTGQLKVLNDRMGPSHDYAMRIISGKIREAKGITDRKGVDPRTFKPRVASLFAVGGSDWVELALPMMNIFTLPMQINVVDQQLFNWVALPGAVLLKDEMLERARRSGRHLVESHAKAVEAQEYIGDPGLCDICHSSLFHINRGTNSAVCGVCGVPGTMVQENGHMVFKIADADRDHAHTTVAGKFRHCDDLKNISLNPDPRMKEVPELKKKYKEFLSEVRV